MNRIRQLAFAAGLLTTLGAAVALAAERRDASIKESLGVRVHVEQKPSISLCFTITNASTKDLLIDRADLPWISSRALTLRASGIDKVSGSTFELRRKLRISDPPAGKVRVAAHDSITGTFTLTRSFDGLDEALARGDILVVWSFQLREGDTPRRFHGTQLFQRTHDEP